VKLFWFNRNKVHSWSQFAYQGENVFIIAPELSTAWDVLTRESKIPAGEAPRLFDIFKEIELTTTRVLMKVEDPGADRIVFY